MADIHECIKEEQPWEETYAEEGLNPMIESPSLKIESEVIVSSLLEGISVKDEPDSSSNFQDCSEFILGIEDNSNIKEEDTNDLIKEEVDIPPLGFDEAASSMNSEMGTENSEEKSVKSDCQKQTIKFGFRKIKMEGGGSLPADDSYGNLTCNLIPADPRQFLKYNPFERSKLDDSTEDSKFLCSVCNKFFTTKYSLNYHSQIHSGAFSYICQYCGKGFSFRVNLDIHIRIHTGEKPFRCSECGERFNDKSNVKRHLLIHTGEKPHQCLVCKKRFTRSSNLARHNYSAHLKVKPFKCSFCDKSFFHIGVLKIHERVHTGEKPYECEICLKRFTRINNMKMHQRVHK